MIIDYKHKVVPQPIEAATIHLSLSEMKEILASYVKFGPLPCRSLTLCNIITDLRKAPIDQDE